MPRTKASKTLKRERKALESAAYHEAGHAVLAYTCGLRIGQVHIHRDDTIDPERPETLARISRGMTEYFHLADVRLWDPRNRSSAESEIMIRIAGAIAEGIYHKRHSWKRLSATDLEPILELTNFHCGGLVVSLVRRQ
jgi:hypothetical protein